MSQYPEDNNGMDVFLRSNNDQPLAVEAPGAADQGGGGNLAPILIALLAIVVTGGAAAAWYLYQPELEFAQPTPVEQAYPYTASVDYLSQYDDLVVIVGPNPTVTNAGDTEVNWSIAGDGYASIHLNMTGTGTDAEAWVDWVREAGNFRGDQGGWIVQSAAYRFKDGERTQIPIGPGTFLTSDELQIWRTADGSTPLGMGLRELIQGHKIQAVQSFNKAIEENPEDPEPLYWLGRSFESLGNLAKAQSAYQRLVELDPENARALARLDAMRASPPPGKPEVEEPRLKAPSPEAAPVNLIPR